MSYKTRVLFGWGLVLFNGTLLTIHTLAWDTSGMLFSGLALCIGAVMVLAP